MKQPAEEDALAAHSHTIGRPEVAEHVARMRRIVGSKRRLRGRPRDLDHHRWNEPVPGHARLDHHRRMSAVLAERADEITRQIENRKAGAPLPDVTAAPKHFEDASSGSAR